MTAMRGPGSEPQAAGRLADEASFRFARDGDEHALLSLLEATFGGWPGVEITVDPLEHLRWKLRSHPIAMRHHVVGEVHGRIVAARCCWAQPLLAHGRRMMLHQAVDVAVHPDYQGRRLMSRMRRFQPDAFARAFHVHFGTKGTHPAMAALWAKEGQRAIGNRVLSFDLALAGRRPPSLVEPSGDWPIATAPRFDPRVDALFALVQREFDALIERSSQYLNWRYCDRRAGAFTVRVLVQDGAMLGYAVLRILRSRGYIADLLALPGRTDVVTSLIEDAIAYFARLDVAAVRCWSAERHVYNGVLERSGFQGRRLKREVTYRLHGATDDDLAFLQDPQARIHFTVGDQDVV